MDVDSISPVRCEWSLLGSGPFGYSALGARMGEELPSETRALFLLRSQLYLNVPWFSLFAVADLYEL